MERDQASTKEADRVMALCFDNALLLKPKILSHRTSCSDWAKEVQMSTQQLQPGKRFSIRKLGSRAAMHMQPFLNSDWNSPLRSIRDK